jgi:hypothetical protein
MQVRILARAEVELPAAGTYSNRPGERPAHEVAAESRRTIARIIVHANAWTKYRHLPVGVD